MTKGQNLVQRMNRNDNPLDRPSPQVDGQDKPLCETLNTDCSEREREVHLQLEGHLNNPGKP